MRIPERMDNGRHFESTMTYILYHYESFKKAMSSGESIDTDISDRYACGFPLPSFQRDLCWTKEQEVRFIESAWIGLPLGTFTIHSLDWNEDGALKYSGWLIDGQQRLTTIQRYLDDDLKVFGLFYSELTKLEKRRFDGVKFTHYEADLWNEDLIRDLYNRLSFGGTTHKESERA